MCLCEGVWVTDTGLLFSKDFFLILPMVLLVGCSLCILASTSYFLVDPARPLTKIDVSNKATHNPQCIWHHYSPFCPVYPGLWGVVLRVRSIVVPGQ